MNAPQPQNSVSDLDDDDDINAVTFVEREMCSGEAVAQFIQNYGDKQHERHRTEEVAENQNGIEVADDDFESINSTKQIQSNNQEVSNTIFTTKIKNKTKMPFNCSTN